MEENSDGNDTNVGSIGNSIEDRINNAYCFLNSMHSDFRTGLYYKEDLENLEHILSDYKRVLKENEELRAKWDKDTHILQNKLDYANADRIDLAQQNKELRKENNRLEEQVEYDKTHIYTPQTIELNFISKSKIEDKIEEEKLPLVIVGGRRNKRTLEYGIKLGRRQALQELLGSEE